MSDEYILYKCPKCGGVLGESILTCFPPIKRVSCSSCGYRYDYPRPTIKYVTFEEPEKA